MLQDKNTNLTPLTEIGEFGLIHRIKNAVKIKNPSTEKAIGDDAAVVDYPGDKTVITTDLLAEGVHFNLGYVPLKHLGYKAVAVNISDLCAMNAVPGQILVSIAISDRFPLEAVDELYAGILSACETYGVDLIGGDTTSSRSGLIINITAIGHQKEEKIVYRNGAKVNDLLVVSGDLGGAYFGLKILERENQVWKVNPDTQPDLSSYEYIIRRQLKPEARVDILKKLAEAGIQPTSMIDISDGLASDTLHLAEESKVAFSIYEDKIPMDQKVMLAADEFSLNPAVAALNGGEDYELLFTVPLTDHEKIQNISGLSVIGYAVEASEGSHVISKGDTQKIPLTAQGWDAFRKSVQNFEE